MAVVVSGVVILAFVVLVAVALLLAAVVADRRQRAVEQQAQFLNSLGRIQSRLARAGRTRSAGRDPHTALIPGRRAGPRS